MIDNLFVIAVICGIIGALFGNRTAFVLLASTAVTNGLITLGVFHPLLWILIDFVAARIILRIGRHTSTDAIIIGLYPMIWLTYFMDGMAAYNVASILSALQLVILLPFEKVWDKLYAALCGHNRTNGFDLKVRHT